MQQFPCPFCGLRDEREFHFAVEAGKTRPDTTMDVSDTAWSNYLYAQANPMGSSQEIWTHLPCREVFVMERDTTTMQVLSMQTLRKVLT